MGSGSDRKEWCGMAASLLAADDSDPDEAHALVTLRHSDHLPHEPVLMPSTVVTDDARLARDLGTWSATAVVIGTIIGSSIFRLPGPVAREAGSAGAIGVLWVLGGAIALAGALSLAELAAAFPRTGGIYVFLRETYGRWAAFLFGWSMLVINPAAYAFVAMVFAESLASVVPALAGAERGIAAVSLIVLVAINIRPVRVGAVHPQCDDVGEGGRVLLALSLAAIAAGFASGEAVSQTSEPAPWNWPRLGCRPDPGDGRL